MSTHVTGRIETIVAALDKAPDDPAVAAITVGDDEPPRIQRHSAPVAEYHAFRTAGVQLLFEQLRGERGTRALAAVFILDERDERFEPRFAAYADQTGLIEGLDLRSSTRADVHRVLGAPYREDGYSLHRVQDERVVHVEYSLVRDDFEDDPADVLRKVTIMARDVTER